MDERQVVTYELEEGVALIGLNRPERRNAINPEIREQLLAAVIRADGEAQCGILYGHGKDFCAGRDLRWAAEVWDDELKKRDPYIAQLDPREYMGRGKIPYVAALHGATLGGGLENACACHVRVADETTYFGLPEATRGIFLGGGGSVRIARIMGFSRMQDMMLTGRMLTAEEGERCGLVHYVVPEGQSLAKAKELAAKICKNAPLSNYAIINAIPRLQDMSQGDGLFFERIMGQFVRSPDSIERLRQFVDKTAAPINKPR